MATSSDRLPSEHPDTDSKRQRPSAVSQECPLADSVVLGTLVDMAMLVIKHKENDRELVRRTARSLNWNRNANRCTISQQVLT